MAHSLSDDLHALIRSLDASEKRHFSLFAKRHVIGERNQYAWLFQEMAAMEVYDGLGLELKMKAAGTATPLAAAKNHLKSLVLRALRDYRSGHDAHTRLLEGLGNLAILHDKKQYALLQKEIKRLKKLATLHCEHHILFKIGDYERRLHKEVSQRNIAEGMEAILTEMKTTTAAFQTQMELTHLLDRMFLTAKLSRSKREPEITALLSHPLLADESLANTLFSRIYFHQILAISHQLRSENRQAMAHYETVVQLWESAPHLIQESPSTYRRILGNYLGICHLLYHYSSFPGLLLQIRNSPCRTAADRAEVFNIGHYFELLWRMGTYDWKAVEGLLPVVRQGLHEHEHFLDQGRMLAFCYNAAIYHLLAQDYPACRAWLREITNRPRGEARLDIQRLARVLGLLCTWALGDLDLLEYQLKAAQRHFEKWGSNALEDLALLMVHDLLAAVDQKAKWKAYESFIAAVQAEQVAQHLGAFELRAWAAAQVNFSRPLDVIQELGD